MSKYEECGVSIQNGDILVSKIKEICQSTYDQNVLEGVGPFCSLYRNPGLSNQIIAASTDGVGTKQLLALQLSEYGYLQTIGVDLVGMVVNDLMTCGASPLFILDYYALSKIQSNLHSEQIIKGISTGCRLAGCALIGGETSEMPSLYDNDQFDLAAFAVGLVDEDCLLGPHKVKHGDVILGLESCGPHSNGYSLIRQVYQDFDWTDEETRHWIMSPTRIYVRLIQLILSELAHGIHAMAHITGGGLEYNISRSIPSHLKGNIDWSSWSRPDIFNDLQRRAKLEEDEMRTVFNCGIGYAIICDASKATKLSSTINSLGTRCYQIGRVY